MQIVTVWPISAILENKFLNMTSSLKVRTEIFVDYLDPESAGYKELQEKIKKAVSLSYQGIGS